MLDSVEHEIFSANKDEIKLAFSYLLAEKVSCSDKCNKKECAIVSNLRFISKTNFILIWVGHEKRFITPYKTIYHRDQLLLESTLIRPWGQGSIFSYIRVFPQTSSLQASSTWLWWVGWAVKLQLSRSSLQTSHYKNSRSSSKKQCPFCKNWHLVIFSEFGCYFRIFPHVRRITLCSTSRQATYTVKSVLMATCIKQSPLLTNLCLASHKWAMCKRCSRDQTPRNVASALGLHCLH